MLEIFHLDCGFLNVIIYYNNELKVLGKNENEGVNWNVWGFEMFENGVNNFQYISKFRVVFKSEDLLK